MTPAVPPEAVQILAGREARRQLTSSLPAWCEYGMEWMPNGELRVHLTTKQDRFDPLTLLDGPVASFTAWFRSNGDLVLADLDGKNEWSPRHGYYRANEALGLDLDGRPR